MFSNIICVDTSGRDVVFSFAKIETDTLELHGTSCENIRRLYAEENFLIIMEKTNSYSAEGRMNENFFPALEQFLYGLGIKAEEIDFWVAITGPGSFTGIRIGLSVLSGMVIGYGKDLAGLSALDATALIKYQSENQAHMKVASKLKFNEYAVKLYDFTENNFSQEIVEIIENIESFVFADIEKYKTKAIFNKKVGHFFTNPDPVYVRKSDAEISFEKKRRNNGF